MKLLKLTPKKKVGKLAPLSVGRGSPSRPAASEERKKWKPNGVAARPMKQMGVKPARRVNGMQ